MSLRDQYTNEYFDRDTVELRYYVNRELRRDQIVAKNFCKGKKRILSVGVGRGFFEEELIRAGHEVVGMDVKDNRHFKHFPFIEGGLEAFPEEREFDAVVLVEVLEHIPEAEFKEAWTKIVNVLRKTGGRFIVTNWEYLHPIPHNGMDHIFRVDDDLFDWLASFARKTVHRHKSELVLEF